MTVQSVDPASCHVTSDGAVPASTCSYGETLFGQEGPDDDCKYHVAWTSTPICEGGAGVVFTLVATYLGTDQPLTGAQTNIEYYIPKVSDAGPDAGYCDDQTTHLGPTLGTMGLYQMTETTPGTYVGQIKFDAPGEWTLRFHFDESCDDVADTSPHGHAAFHITVP
jgi:hypothetical protein